MNSEKFKNLIGKSKSNKKYSFGCSAAKKTNWNKIKSWGFCEKNRKYYNFRHWLWKYKKNSKYTLIRQNLHILIQWIESGSYQVMELQKKNLNSLSITPIERKNQAALPKLVWTLL